MVIIDFVKMFGGAYLGWGIGANDGANIIGPHVGSNLLSYRFCITLLCVFIILGSVISGQGMVENVGKIMPDVEVLQQYSPWTLVNIAVLVTISAALAVNIATYLGIPTSTSQGAIGAFFGFAIVLGIQENMIAEIPPWEVFGKMLGSWIISPFLAALLGFIIQKWGSKLFTRLVTNERIFNRIIVALLVFAGAYGAYILGATHAGIAVAPFYVAGVFKGWLGIEPATWAVTVGGLSIALGSLTYSKNVIYSVGTKITTLDPFSAFSTVVAMSICLNVFKEFGVPVSSSQAIVGAVTGVGLTRGTQAVSFSTLRKIAIGWIATPVFPAIVTGLVYALITALFYAA
ncbi:MAG: inorganic phosphate transporter [bacterium]